jgi:hypothetical protein
VTAHAIIHAPFSEAEVVALNRFQNSGAFHPFTCPNRSDTPHRWDGFDKGILVATTAGWTCADCDYQQDWAFAFMAGPSTLPDHGRR